MAVICIVMYRKLQYFLWLKDEDKIPGIFRAKQGIFYGQFNRTEFKPPFLNANNLLIRRHLKGFIMSVERRQTALRKSCVIVCSVVTELDDFKFTRSRHICKLILIRTVKTMNLETANG